MLDRASTFAHPIVVELLKTRFVPVAIDQAYQRRQKDAEGEFYRKIAGQGPRHDFQGTTQGFYVATAAGDLLFYNNNRDPEKLARLMRQALAEMPSQSAVNHPLTPPEPEQLDPRYNAAPPDGGLVVRVRAKVLGGYQATDNRWQVVFQNALSRDNLWITPEEHQALVGGKLPQSLQRRMARFHLVDNTRGEPPMWKDQEIRKLDIHMANGKLHGTVRLENERQDRGYDAELKGIVKTQDGRVVRFDLVALGDFWGEGRFTRNAPPGKFPLAVAFTLADGTDVADAIPPQGSRGWVAGYLHD